MPKRYEKIRDALIAGGKGEVAAKSEAAAIYNSSPKHKKHPVTGKYERKARR